jgi:hypothetical protein
LHRLDPIDLAHAHRDRRRWSCLSTRSSGGRLCDISTWPERDITIDLSVNHDNR